SPAVVPDQPDSARATRRVRVFPEMDWSKRDISSSSWNLARFPDPASGTVFAAFGKRTHSRRSTTLQALAMYSSYLAMGRTRTFSDRAAAGIATPMRY